MNNLHPAFAAIFAAHSQAVIATGRAMLDADLAAYRQALREHDWEHEYSDEHAVYMRGKAQRDALRAEQRRIDPDAAIWNECAPPQYRLLVEDPAIAAAIKECF